MSTVVRFCSESDKRIVQELAERGYDIRYGWLRMNPTDTFVYLDQAGILKPKDVLYNKPNASVIYVTCNEHTENDFPNRCRIVVVDDFTTSRIVETLASISFNPELRNSENPELLK